MNARSTPDGFALLSLDIDVPDSEQLRTVMRRHRADIGRHAGDKTGRIRPM